MLTSSREFDTTDALVEEYLAYRGFVDALSGLRREAAADRLGKYNVDAFIDRIRVLLGRPTVDELLDFWTFSERNLFSRLNETFEGAMKAAATSVIRLWIVEMVKRVGPATDGARAALDGLFSKHGERFRSESAATVSTDLDWTPWFALPFCKDPSSDTYFSKYFSPEWCDVTLSSLRNLVSIVFSQTPKPALLQFRLITLRLEESHSRIAELEHQLQLEKSSQLALKRQIAQQDSVITALRARLDGREMPSTVGVASSEDVKLSSIPPLGALDESAILNGLARSVGGEGDSDTATDSDGHTPRQTRTRSGGIVSEDLPK